MNIKHIDLNELENFSYDDVGNRQNNFNSNIGSGASYDYTTNNLNQYTSLSGSISKYTIQEIIEEIQSGSGSESGSGTTETGSGSETGSGETNTGTTQIVTYSGGLVNEDDSNNFVYDNNGNIVSNGKYSFVYDYKNRIVKVNDGTGTIAEYWYDVLDRRYRKETSTKAIDYVYSNENILRESITSSGVTSEKDYINGLGVDDLVAYELDGNRYYYSKNHLGSIDGISNNSGNVVVSYEYDSYGNATQSGSDIGNDRLFTGREYDSEIGLYYFRARYYDSKIGRFISRDPIDIADDVNLYGYVGENPINFVDLKGLEKTLIFWGEDYLSHEWYRSGGKDNFKLKADAYREYLISIGGDPNNIIVTDGTTFENWQNALKNNGKIKRIVYYGHSGEAGLYLGDTTPDDLTDNDTSIDTIYNHLWTGDLLNRVSGGKDHNISDLYTNNSIGAKISLYGCHTSDGNLTGEIDSLAYEFAKEFKGVATGSNGNVKFKSKELFGLQFLPYVDKSTIDKGENFWDTFDFRE